jgi:hypothetical protein
VQVRVVKAGRDETAFEINRACARVSAHDLGVSADGDDAFVINGDGLRDCALRVGGKILPFVRTRLTRRCGDVTAARDAGVTAAKGGNSSNRRATRESAGRSGFIKASEMCV